MGNQVAGYTAVYDPKTGRVEQKEIVVSVEESNIVSPLDAIEAQVAYTAMMTGTLLEV